MSGTRERIITATNELFRRQGFHATSLQEISAASEATIGSIYHFFPAGKEALGVAVVESTGEVYRDLFVAIVDAEADTADAYRVFFRAAGEVLEQSGWLDPCPIGGIAREVANTSEPLRLAAGRAFTSWVDAAAAHLGAAGVPAPTARSLALTFVAAVEGTFVLSRTLRSTEPLLAAGDHVASLTAAAVAAAVPTDA